MSSVSRKYKTTNHTVRHPHMHEQLYGLLPICDPNPTPNPYAEALMPDVPAFGHVAFREVIKVKCCHRGGAPTDRIVSTRTG